MQHALLCPCWASMVDVDLGYVGNVGVALGVNWGFSFKYVNGRRRVVVGFDIMKSIS